MINRKELLKEAQNFADRQRREFKKIIKTDAARLKTYLEKERREIQKLQTRLPGEIKKIRQYAETQRRELDKLIKKVKTASKKAAGTAKSKVVKRKSTARTTKRTTKRATKRPTKSPA